MDYVITKDRQTRLLTWMWWGIAAYTLLILIAEWVYRLGDIAGGLTNRIVPISCLLLLFSIRWNNNNHTRSGKILIYLLLAVTLSMFLRSGIYTLAWQSYINPYLFVPYIATLLLLIPSVPLIRSFYIANNGFMYLGVVLVFIPILRYTNNGNIQFLFETLILGASMVLLCGKYHNKRTIIWSIVCLSLGLLTSTITARRNLMVTIALYMMICGFQYLFGSKIKSMATRLWIILTALVVFIIGAFIFLQNQKGMFSTIAERATENTRDIVLANFALDFAEEPIEVLYGRSMAGTYHCYGSVGDNDNSFGEGERPNIECGYLQMILKGGVIYMVIYLIVLIYAMVQGFRARNQLLKACAWLLAVQLIDMIPFGLPAFNIKTFMLWMAIALCFDNNLRQKNDEEIQQLIYTPIYSLPQWKKGKS